MKKERKPITVYAFGLRVLKKQYNAIMRDKGITISSITATDGALCIKYITDWGCKGEMNLYCIKREVDRDG